MLGARVLAPRASQTSGREESGIPPSDPARGEVTGRTSWKQRSAAESRCRDPTRASLRVLAEASKVRTCTGCRRIFESPTGRIGVDPQLVERPSSASNRTSPSLPKSKMLTVPSGSRAMPPPDRRISPGPHPAVQVRRWRPSRSKATTRVADEDVEVACAVGGSSRARAKERPALVRAAVPDDSTPADGPLDRRPRSAAPNRAGCAQNDQADHA